MSLIAAPVAAQPAAPAPGASAPAPAADAPKLAIAPIAISGAEDPLLASQLEQDLRGGLARGSLQLLDSEAVARVAGGPCSDDACLERLRDQLGAAFVLRAQVTVSDRDYTLRLELVATRDLGRAAESERGCELCGLAELRALTADQAARLLAKLDALAKPPPAFEIATTPPGALVFIDGQLVGAAPVERNVLEGKHVVRVMSEGYVPEERELVAVAGLRESLQIDLRRTPESLKLRGAGWGLLFTGIPLLAAGVALLALDGDEYRGRCSGPDVDLSGRCRFVFNTDWGGAGLMAAGALLGTAGTMLLLRTRDRGKTKLRARLGPTYIGLSGAF
ncbi:PEGA domain-containing protein [Nannocystis radixulma]|uniref:PEGA domain-containing protein n=1 Tax=Nannocystis radixulma TaxID=2995305 RepID=A0ABT5BJ77_9BACT|nr:PEGA domain-containing protein [Nannocystis radixulma]MDC0674188.1 PEGA domain-containing protein [Nannocystis radixulma]